MLAMAWFVIIVIGLILYVTLDGNDLGIGILCLTRRHDSQRHELLKLVAPVWDGAESWILLVAVGLWGGFPAATGALLPAVYLPIIVMLWSLFMRGVSIEMIVNGGGWSRRWGTAFMAGSLGAAFAQGVLIGAVVQGVRLGPDSLFVGGTWDFLSGYTVLTGLTTVVLFSLAGAAMVKMRSDDAGLRSMARKWGRALVVASVALVALSGSLLPVAGASSLRLDQPFRVALLVAACLVASTMLTVVWWSIGRPDHDYMAFVAWALLVISGLFGLLVLAYPMIVPSTLTIAHAASPNSSLEFLLAGVTLFVPVAAAYNAWAFWALRPRRAPLPGPLPELLAA
jgi:cytochrome d ubiquinol oxidase subunit II